MTVAPGLADDPLAHVDAVGTVVEIFDEAALAGAPSARVLENDGIAVCDKEGSDFTARPDAAACIGFSARGRVASVRRPSHDHRKSSGGGLVVQKRQIDVSRELCAVSHRHHHALCCARLIYRSGCARDASGDRRGTKRERAGAEPAAGRERRQIPCAAFRL